MKNLEKWISSYIVELNLCPFAANTLQKDKWKDFQINFQDATEIETVFNSFLDENPKNIDSYFLHSQQLLEWEDFLFYYHFLEDLTKQISKFDGIKIVGFHPKYKHGEIENAVLNYSNRAPWPLIQLLNAQDVEKRTSTIDVQVILDANEATLENLGAPKLNELLNECK